MENTGTEHTETMTSKVQAILLRGGLTEAEYRGIVDGLRMHNRHLGIIILSLLCVMFAALSSIGVFNSEFADYLPLYRVAFLSAATLLILDLTLARRVLKCSTLILYLTALLIFAYATIVGINFGTGQTAVTVCIFIVVAPLVILDRPIRLFSVPLVSTVVYCVAALALKDPDVAFVDVVDCICCCFFGMLLASQNAKARAYNMVYSQRISRERDEDGLTKLLNKSAFERFATAFVQSGEQAILIILDADNFKRINDLYGHDEGDLVLHGMGACIDLSFRKSDLKGRFGGDEFVVLLRGTADKDVAVRAVRNLLNRANAQVLLPNPDDKFCCSAGVAFCEGDGVSYEELFKKADLALYEAKHAGGNCYRLAQ